MSPKAWVSAQPRKTAYQYQQILINSKLFVGIIYRVGFLRKSKTCAVFSTASKRIQQSEENSIMCLKAPL